ncbi:MAG: glutathione S-transferase [Pseudorhodobacter sp. PARRP1]|nr:MAG: glutathione S-transferase [Pseudorhodobacter sp. PARRP1]
MLTLFHAPQSRSSAIVTLIEEMGITEKVDIRMVDIVRARFGTGAADAANPHPEKKAPCLVHDGHIITERGAIMTHLTTLFPSGMAPQVGTPAWGAFLTWMNWYQGVMEPVLVLDFAKVVHPALTATFRGMDEVTARIRAALERGPWLLGDHFTAADLLVHSPYAWFDNVPDDPLIKDWVARCMARPARLKVLAADASQMAA